MKNSILLVDPDMFFTRSLQLALESDKKNLVTISLDELNPNMIVRYDAVVFRYEEGTTERIITAIRKIDNYMPIAFYGPVITYQIIMTLFKLGADIDLCQPFHSEELSSRITRLISISKHLRPKEKQHLEYKLGTLCFVYSDLRLIDTRSGSYICITTTEADLLKYLCERPNQIMKKENILKAVWGRVDYFSGRSMDVYLSKIRKHLNLTNDVSIVTKTGYLTLKVA